ncbi:hypothetical protein GLYMA_08G020100v4 [Glycine max]|uniref:Uncharacterized protein n=2 Tax=Glycine subgen. Soja TaxID=1462606 RepID=K7L4H5_SOYBN|nr:hypothetical protein GYH30_019978 [Glycine max]KRH41267.1 hypothetical protein GLYMA_08G020100v4 [Glycine max]RZB94833.1 hypothetical protein D0Y65_019362 [Glycine soja]
MAASLRRILQLHKASRFYSEGLGLNTNVCTLRWAELQSGPLKLALMQCPKYISFSFPRMPSIYLIICQFVTYQH